MDIFHALTMLGGLCLFLFGMNFMGQALERRAGGKLRTLPVILSSSVRSLPPARRSSAWPMKFMPNRNRHSPPSMVSA